MQLNGNTLIDLFERIKDLLRDGRIDIVYNVANKQDLNFKLRQTFRSLADLIALKNSQIDKMKEFYRACINKIVENGNEEEILANQYSTLSNELKEPILELSHFVSILKADKQSSANEHIAQIKELQDRLIQIDSEKIQMETAFQHQIESFQREIQLYRDKLQDENEIKMEVEMKNGKIKELQSKLTAKEAEINILQTKFSVLQKKYQEIQEEYEQKAKNLSNSISMESEKFSQIIKEKDEEIDSLRSRLSNDNLNLKASILSSSLTNQLIIPASISDALEKQIGKAVRSMDKLYNFSQQKRYNFHESIDRKSNILLVCQTVDDHLVGAFTTACFSLNTEPLSTKAFLFVAEGEEISVSSLKRGRESVAYDLDFLIFGNDELCIEKGKGELTSYAPNAISSQLHYEPIKADYFAAALGNGRVELKNYEIFQVQFDE